MDVTQFGGYLTPGIRAQLLNTEKMNLVMDFVIEQGEDSTHILNAVSPAFTAAFSFSKYIVDQVERETVALKQHNVTDRKFKVFRVANFNNEAGQIFHASLFNKKATPRNPVELIVI